MVRIGEGVCCCCCVVVIGEGVCCDRLFADETVVGESPVVVVVVETSVSAPVVSEPVVPEAIVGGAGVGAGVGGLVTSTI